MMWLRVSMLYQSVLYVLDIYNDAADMALNNYAQRFLYDEVEAEVNLAFEQLVQVLSATIYLAAKRLVPNALGSITSLLTTALPCQAN